jgi:hypothetical protein
MSQVSGVRSALRILVRRGCRRLCPRFAPVLWALTWALRLAVRTLVRSGAGYRPSTTPAGLALRVHAERFAIRTNFPVNAHRTGRLAKPADDDDSENRVQRRKRKQDRGCHTALIAPATVLNRQTSGCDPSHKTTTRSRHTQTQYKHAIYARNTRRRPSRQADRRPVTPA